MKKPAKKTTAPTGGKYCWLKEDLLTGALVCEQASRWMKGIVASRGERVTPRVIAARLDKFGIKGEPGNERECPLARALANHLADFFGWDLVVLVNTEGALMGMPFYADDGQINYMLRPSTRRAGQVLDLVRQRIVLQGSGDRQGDAMSAAIGQTGSLSLLGDCHCDAAG